jgi:methylmalonyl-CoA mutase
MATRGARELPEGIGGVVEACKAAGYDLVILETPGIGQGDAAIVPLADVSLYVMTPEFGAASQLEKIDMLDFADVVAINKFERRGAADALRDVSRQLVRNREAYGGVAGGRGGSSPLGRHRERPEDMPVFGTSAATFNDDGVTALYQHLAGLLGLERGVLPEAGTKVSTGAAQPVPAGKVRYLSEIAETVRGYHAETGRQVAAVRRVQRLDQVRAELSETAAEEVGTLLDQARRDVTPGNAALIGE